RQSSEHFTCKFAYRQGATYRLIIPLCIIFFFFFRPICAPFNNEREFPCRRRSHSSVCTSNYTQHRGCCFTHHFSSALGVVAPSMASPPELLPPIGHLLKLEKDVKKKIAEKEHQMRVTFFFLNVHKLGNPRLTHKKNYRTRWSTSLQINKCRRQRNGRIKNTHLEIHTLLIKKKCHLKKELVRKRGRRKEEGAFPSHPPDVGKHFQTGLTSDGRGRSRRRRTGRGQTAHTP
ncbi:WD domain G-beta repeat domain containing protein, partial [Plasmodium cynomolgi strain B]